MPHLPAWGSSPEKQEGQKLRNDISHRLETVRNDIKRVQPKLNTYKKTTLARLIKEAEANAAAALKQNNQINQNNPFRNYVLKIRKLSEEILVKEKAEFDKFVKEIVTETKASLDACNYDGEPIGNVANNIYNAYTDQVKMFKDELAKAKDDDHARTV